MKQMITADYITSTVTYITRLCFNQMSFNNIIKINNSNFNLLPVKLQRVANALTSMPPIQAPLFMQTNTLCKFYLCSYGNYFRTLNVQSSSFLVNEVTDNIALSPGCNDSPLRCFPVVLYHILVICMLLSNILEWSFLFK